MKCIEVAQARRGVVLFITLAVIASMLALVGVIFSYLDKSRDNASYTAALIQADLIFRDSKETIETLLKQGSKDKEMKKTILDTLYLAPVTIETEGNEEIFITLDCQPLNNGININWLGLENNASAQHFYAAAQGLFDRLVERYNIQDASLLLIQLRSAVDGSERLESQGRLEQKKGIIDLSQMQAIVRDYRFEADDDEVEKIIWENYFSFDQPDSLVDGNYLTAELIAVFFEMELETVKEEWFEGDDLKAFVSTYGGDLSRYSSKLFASDPIERMTCRITYGYQGKVYAMDFDYLEGKAEKFEFYGKQ